MLLQSMSGMGNNRGYARLILNKANYRKVAWATVKALPRSERLSHMHSALSDATVRMPEQKARWLIDNFDTIERMGGIAAALKQKRNLKGRAEKLTFFRQFLGIGDKYGPNIWMDLCDPDFHNAIAIDVRLKKIYELLGIPTDDYERAEQAMLEIAREAGLTGWDLDRLLFHFSDHFLAAIFGDAVTADREGNEPDKGEHTVKRGKPTSWNSRRRTVPISHDAGSAVQKWERIYESFLTCRNTSTWGKRAEHAKKILTEFNSRVPLATIVDDIKRKALCEKLFGSTNDFNYVIYTLGMGVWLVALGRDDEHLVVVRPELIWKT
jgi:hypothetical protein